MSNALAAQLQQRLAQHQAKNYTRIRTPCTPLATPYVKQHDATHLNFTSNDYLALSQHPAVIESLQTQAQLTGLGALGSSLAQGHTHIHHQLETRIAQWLNYPRALIFTSGYMAVIAAITSLIHREDFIAVDKQCHASVFDAIELTQASWQRYADSDMPRLEKLLATNHSPLRFIMTSGVFSMQGHLAPLPELIAMAKHFHATLIVDDVHATGVLGDKGQGSIAHLNFTHEDVPLVIGSLTKGLGTMGAFIAGSELMIETILQFARPYMFSTALPTALAAASITAIDLAAAADAQRQHLKKLMCYFQEKARDLKWPVLPSVTPIQAIVFPDIASMQQVAKQLLAKNILVSAIRPPSVAKNTPRIRLSFTAAHQLSDIDCLLEGLKNAG